MLVENFVWIFKKSFMIAYENDRIVVQSMQVVHILYQYR